MEPSEIWESLGGYEGLTKMRENAEIMLALAAYAQRWNFTEAVIVTERMRLDAALLRRAVRRVELSLIPFRLLRRYQANPPPPRSRGFFRLLPDAPAPALPLSNQPCRPLSQAGGSPVAAAGNLYYIAQHPATPIHYNSIHEARRVGNEAGRGAARRRGAGSYWRERD